MNGTPFEYKNHQLFCDGVDLTDIAERDGTPSYVYSSQGITERFRAYDEALAGIDHRICYAVKANSNLSVLRLLADAGIASSVDCICRAGLTCIRTVSDRGASGGRPVCIFGNDTSAHGSRSTVVVAGVGGIRCVVRRANRATDSCLAR